MKEIEGTNKSSFRQQFADAQDGMLNPPSRHWSESNNIQQC